MGGIALKETMDVARQGIHIITCTPGRLIDMLNKKLINLDICRLLVMDEADRMVDVGFEDDMRTVFSYFKVCPWTDRAACSCIG